MKKEISDKEKQKKKRTKPSPSAEKSAPQKDTDSGSGEVKAKRHIPIITPFGKMAEENLLYIVYAVSMVLDSLLLRCFTVKLGEAKTVSAVAKGIVKPLLADIFAVLLIGAICFAFKKQKNRFRFLMVLTSVFTILCFGNAVYYKNFKSFLSISYAATGSVLGGVMDAVTNLLEPKHFILLFPFIAVPLAYRFVKKKQGSDSLNEKQPKPLRRSYAGASVKMALLALVMFAVQLTKTDCSRLVKQWNRESVMATYGMMIYQASDAVSCTYSNIMLMFGYEESKKKFDEFFDSSSEAGEEAEIMPLSDEELEEPNEYTGIFKGKNIIVIHCESMQQFVLDTYFGGEPVAPNLRRLASEGLYFSNFYTQESIGTSSDSEFTFSSSLMPASRGTVAINYYDRDYATTQKKLGELGYYVFSMHGNNGSYWNRLNLHASLGYDRLYHYTNDFVIDETIGLGLSDKSFFRQLVPKIKEIDAEHEQWAGTLIMLTNHTPFTDIDRVSDFDVGFTYKQYNEETGMYEEIHRDFLDHTKLGSYFKSTHYADEALGQLFDDLDAEGLLDNTVVVLYGDHDAKIKEDLYEYYYNYDPFTDETLSSGDEGYIPMDEFYYNLNRKTPFIIWSKDGGYEPQEITRVMGMYDVQPTLGNMFGFTNKYALGHDIFSVGDEDNVVIFPNGNFITDKVYYDSQRETYFDIEGYENVAKFASCNQVYKDIPSVIYNELRDGSFKQSPSNYSEDFAEQRKNNGAVDEEYIEKYMRYAEQCIDVSNSIIYYDIIDKVKGGFDTAVPPESRELERSGAFAPLDAPYKRRFGAA